MTSPGADTVQIMVAGEPASSALSDLRSFAGNLVGHFAENVVPCGLLPREELDGDVTRVTMGCLALAVGLLDERRVPTDEDLAAFTEAAAQWAREGIPLETILRVFHEGIKVSWQHIAHRADAGDVDDMADATHLLISMLENVTVAATSAYISELKIVASEHHTASHTLVTALLSGQSTTAMARQCGIAVAPEYLVLAVHIPAHPDELRPDVRRSVPARRKLRRVQAQLATSCGRRSLSLLSPQGGTVLIPHAPQEEWVSSLVESLGSAAEVPITVTAVQARTPDVPTASEQAHELLELTGMLHSDPGVYRMSDLVLEYQMMRPGAGREHLISLLEPLNGSPELVETLEVHIANDLSRQRTARRLHVHANTVDYRLRRIGQLTGLDPTRPSELRSLQAALVARRIAKASAQASAQADAHTGSAEHTGTQADTRATSQTPT
ncbi:PucR family transcriptional regulator [Rhodococcus sp. D2-41]|uniref:Helix-turn-helix domain-containing protein n=1 Tax=Speluncibacter jeojiensis TaxID=2710754 RepID=A0A9X4LZM6_9ACTN|nr:PucR family transcriptional regulator [Rhodococcus sp. D2-41]MDG3009795.1 PucR family transcriptional regulator [Rhodococcus sp. D2-41]MDG3014546.1 helix-turn-helix domain-containing protein [Corynebacteriales bacterium D3-21]